jgi:hypothetical protein
MIFPKCPGTILSEIVFSGCSTGGKEDGTRNDSLPAVVIDQKVNVA